MIQSPPASSPTAPAAIRKWRRGMSQPTLPIRLIPARRCGAVLTVVAVACGAGCRSPQQTASAAPAKEDVTRRSPEGVGCLGRIEPSDGVVHVAARALGGQPSIVGRLLVKEGDAVHVGEVLAELESRHQLEAAMLQAAAQIEVARKR